MQHDFLSRVYERDLAAVEQAIIQTSCRLLELTIRKTELENKVELPQLRRIK